MLAIPKVTMRSKTSKPLISAKSKSAKDVRAVLRKAIKPTRKAESDESSDSDNAKPTLVRRAYGTAKDVQSDDEDDSSSADEQPEPSQLQVSPPKKVASSSSSSEDTTSNDEEPSKPSFQPGLTKKPAPPQKALNKQLTPSVDDDTSESSDDDISPSGKATLAKNTAPMSDDSDEESEGSGGQDSDHESPQSVPKPKVGKRKAHDSPPTPPKKLKLANGEATPSDSPGEEIKSIFVGKLSWNVDNEWLAQEFAECGKVASATVQMDRNTGKSRGFGYVHFTTAEAVQAALAMNGKEIDGRAVNIDKSQPLDKNRIRESRAKAFGDESGPPSNTLFVGNLSFGVAEDTLWGLFGEYGQVKSVRLPTDRETGRPKGFGYVEFDDVEGAKRAYEGARNLDVEGRAIRLDFSQPRDSGSGRGLGDRGGWGGRRSGGRGFGDRGGRGGRGGFGDRGARGSRGRGGARRGGIATFEGKKTTFS